ncbi:SDR family oxidoreductase [Rubrivirga sp.]|uniref:SDR family oxidoreductase n=1 Tax=Rubrivirga sp. TaxID=1885344 RepID=UPI003C728BF5
MIPPRILITGANGLVGQALTRAASRWPGADVLATGRGPSVWPSPGGYARLDVLDAASVERTFQDFAPDVVLHSAGEARVEPCEADREACWALNVDAVATMASLCDRHGAKLILPSTDFVFDGAAGPYDESARPAPISAYGRSKLAAENVLHASRLSNWSVVRTTMVFGVPAGPSPRLDFVRWVARELSADRPVRVPDDQLRTPTYDDDLADGVLRIARYDRRGLFHISGRESMPVLEVAKCIANVFDLDASLISPASSAEIHPGAPRPLRAGLLILRAESELGYRPRPLEVGLEAVRSRLRMIEPA